MQCSGHCPSTHPAKRALANVAKTLVAPPGENHQTLENSQVRRHEEDSADRLRLHPAKSSGLQECQANLAPRRLEKFPTRLRMHSVLSAGIYQNFTGVFARVASQLAVSARSSLWPFRRQTALQYSTFSQSRAVLRLNSIGSPQTLHTFTPELRRFKTMSLSLDSDVTARSPKLWTLVSIPTDLILQTPEW